jgi:hypothetical protein
LLAGLVHILPRTGLREVADIFRSRLFSPTRRLAAI